jgi:hypothetical protein
VDERAPAAQPIRPRTAACRNAPAPAAIRASSGEDFCDRSCTGVAPDGPSSLSGRSGRQVLKPRSASGLRECDRIRALPPGFPWQKPWSWPGTRREWRGVELGADQRSGRRTAETQERKTDDEILMALGDAPLPPRSSFPERGAQVAVPPASGPVRRPSGQLDSHRTGLQILVNDPVPSHPCHTNAGPNSITRHAGASLG